MLADPKSGFRLGPWEVRPLNGEIHGPGGSMHLEPKVMEVLVVLARQPGQVIERDALLREVWGARAAVSDEPLTRCIAELRRALGDSRQTPAFIQTVSKRGYRLISEVGPLSAAMPLDARPQPDQPAVSAQHALTRSAPVRARRLRSAMLAATVGVAGLGAWLIFTAVQQRATGTSADGAPIARNTIAVLPFVNVGATADAEHFSEGLADEILNRLNAVEGLRVVARTSSFSFKDSNEDVRSIAERLRVAHVLEGSVRRSGDQIRINAQLIDAERGYQLWSESYQGVLGDIFSLQDDIANAIVTSLHDNVPTLPAQAAISTRPPTENLAAYELLLRGRQHLNRRDEQSLRRSIGLFRQAIDLDPNYGQAYVELAKAYVLLPSYSSELQDEMFDLAMATLGEGIDKDASVDQAMQGLLALIAYVRWDWIAAEIAFRRALEHSANDPDVLLWYSQFLSSVGRLADSLRQAQRAKEIDLLSPVVNHRLSVAHLWVDDDQQALRYAQIAEELGMGATANPDSYIVLKLRFAEYDAVRPMLIGVQTMFAQPTAWVDPLLAALTSSQQVPSAVRAIASAEESRDIARKYLFGAWLYLGETDRALATALQLMHDRPSFNVEFLFSTEAKALRSHPRFGELVRAIGLNRYWDQFGWPEMCRKNGEEIICV
jgi:TolB-like protein/DNA-binding winged helix-turn-helix (wHTH) protein